MIDLENSKLFSPWTHPDLITGLRFGIVDRMWLIRHGEKTEEKTCGKRTAL